MEYSIMHPEKDPYVGKLIQIQQIGAHGHQFLNLTNYSIHSIVEPPEGFYNDAYGVWVWGVGEPVRILNPEFWHLKGLDSGSIPSKNNLQILIEKGEVKRVRHSLYDPLSY